MLDFLRREKREVAPSSGGIIQADLSGAVVHGPVAIGEHIVQIHADHGAVVNYAAPEERPVPRLRPSPVRRLPRDFAGLLGREEVVATLHDAIARDAPVEVHGPAGIGKTAVLRYLAHRPGLDDDRSVLFTSWGRQPLEDVLQFVFEGLYECEQAFVPSPAQLAEYLQEPAALVVLDEVTEGRESLERLMDAAPACGFVSAGEERRLWGEGRSILLAGLGEDAALALFERELGASLSGTDREAAAAFCRAVDDPLRVLYGADLVRRGELRLAALASAASSGSPALESQLAASLSERERQALAPLSAVPGAAIGAERVAAITGDAGAPAVLASLEQRGVVESRSPRYALRPALSGAVGDGERALDETLDELADWSEREPPPGEAAAAADAILTAVNAGARAGRSGAVLRLARSADAGLALSGRWGAWGEVLEHGLTAARSLGDQAEEAWALHQLGSRALPRGDTAFAEESLVAALELRERLGDTGGARFTRHNLDVLRGGPPSGGPPKPPKGPWRPPFAVLLALGAAAIAAAVIALSQGGSDQATAPGGGASSTGGAAPPGTAPQQAPPAQGEPAGGGGGTPAPTAIPASIPGELTFDSAAVSGGQSSGTVTAKNKGPVAIRLGDVALSPTDDFSISGDGCGGRQLVPGGTCDVALVFAPRARSTPREGSVPLSRATGSSGTSDAGATTPPEAGRPSSGGSGSDIRRATLTFSDTGTGQPHDVALSGEATSPDIR